MVQVTDERALLSGSYWTGSETADTPAFVTFSFSRTVPVHQTPDYASAGFRSLDDHEKALARAALKTWADTSGLTFLEVAPGKGDIEFGVYDFDRIAGMSGYAGFAYYPWMWNDEGTGDAIPTVSGGIGGDVFLASAWFGFDDDNDTHLLLHEIGHALGLKHPFEETFAHPYTLTPSTDNHARTVMSYTGDYRPALGDLDKAAIRRIYGPASADGAAAADWSWSKATETLTQIGKTGSDTLLGVSVRDVIEGRGGHDVVSGLAGDDRLEGGAGNDTLYGGLGADVLLPGTGTDRVYGGAGVDTVSFEDAGKGVTANLATLAFGGGAAGDVVRGVENVTGSDFADRLTGDAGANVLRGGKGADALDGGAGQDTASFVGSKGGVTVDLASGRGSRGDATGDTYKGIERLVGSGASDVLKGDGVANRIDGGAGDDHLHGRGGKDVLVGGKGDDWFVFDAKPVSGSADSIVDFGGGDRLVFDEDAYAGLGGPGGLASGAFRSTTSGEAGDRSDRFVFDSRKDALWYDADGTGSKAAVLVATFDGNPVLSVSDFLIVA